MLELYVSSRDRVHGESATDFMVRLTTLSNETGNYRIQLKQAIFPNLLPNFRVGVNHEIQLKLYITYPSSTYSFENQWLTFSFVTLTRHYTPSDFALVFTDGLIEFLNGLDNGFSLTNTDIAFTYDSSSYAFSIEIKNLSLKIQWVGGNAIQFRSLETIGFRDDERKIISLSANQSYTGNAIQFSGPQFVDVHADFQNSAMNSNNAVSTIARIPLVSVFGEIEVYTPSPTEEGQLVAATFLRAFRLWLTDEYGLPIIFPGGANTSFVFGLSEISLY